MFGVLIGIAAAWKRRSKTDYAATTFTMATYAMPDFWLGMLLLVLFARRRSAGSRSAGSATRLAPRPGSAQLLDEAHHMFLPALTLTIAYLGEYALVMRSSLLDTMREDYLVLARAKGLRDVIVRNRHAVPERAAAGGHARSRSTSASCSPARSRSRRSSPGPVSGSPPTRRSTGPDLPMLQGLFLVFSASVILFNFVADLLYAYLDPRVRTA